MQPIFPNNESVEPKKRIDHNSDEFQRVLERIGEITRLTLDTLDIPEEGKSFPVTTHVDALAVQTESWSNHTQEDMVFIAVILSERGVISLGEVLAQGFRLDLTTYQSRRSQFRHVLERLDLMLVDENGQSRIERMGDGKGRMYRLRNAGSSSEPIDIVQLVQQYKDMVDTKRRAIKAVDSI